MKISALRLFNVKRFANRGVAIEGIGDGVNVLCAANEFGKSTSFEALHALFFQRHSGMPDAVRKLRPYSGGNPMVEADITTAKGQFRLAKQFYSGGWARITDLQHGNIIAQADEAEHFIANLVKGGTAGPAGLLWVRQGLTGIEKRSNAEEEGEKQVRRSLLESVQGEVEAITGGRRMAEIMTSVTQELEKLVSKRGPRAGGRYALALEEKDRLREAETKLADEVGRLRAALDQRTAAMRRLSELDHAEERQARRLARENAQKALDRAKAHGEKMRAAEAELQLVREQRKAAEASLSSFDEALARANTLAGRLQAKQQKLSQVADERRAASVEVDVTRADLDAAEVAEKEARDLLTRLEAGLRARAASQLKAELEHKLDHAEKMRLEIEQGEARRDTLRIRQEDVDALQKLEIEIAQLRAVEEAGKPSVSISYHSESAVRVSLDEQTLEDGSEQSYEETARLSIPGVAMITLRSSQSSQVGARLRKLEENRSNLLNRMGATGLAQARETQARGQELDAGLRELKARFSLVAPEGLAKLRQALAACEVEDKGELLELKADPEQLRTEVSLAQQKRELARQRQREVEPRRAQADEAFVAVQMAIAALQAEKAQIDAILGTAQEEWETRRATLAATRAALEARHEHAQSLVDSLCADAVDLEAAMAASNRACSVEEAADKEIAALRERLAGLNAQIRAGSDEAVEEEWQETREALELAQARVTAFEKEIAVLQKLGAALETARAQARELYLKPVVNELKPLLSLLFDDVAISFDDKSLLPEKIIRSGQEEDVERLSGGMREQLSVLTRLAFARLLARDGRPAPVVLDDALVYSDDDRIEKMFDALHRQARDQQIIVFSCRQRAFQKLGGNVLEMIDWQP
ncbi:AAA family ATPase [Aerobium aerolatum]|uniref:DNA repair exonuclease SbcCD ATPase subunit n=1 Tax=Aquamicrobium aerolatum DSM 21857 TaxID=1121003 RepID=A0A1I3RZI2_9HYPH|nr:AAA family ATPase [Aquamicrobium aerolatum]SFJ50719.1 DNA repair exonuclease SbcCD ATPase subunit [Aquamicrobium aerolatum DSM 21857]